MTTIQCSEFVKRQTEASRFSYYDGTWEQLAALTKNAYEDARNVHPGYREGVLLVEVPAEGFYSPIIALDESCDFMTVFEARREGEDAGLITTITNKEKSPARHVRIVLYAHHVLAEDNEQSCDADYEIISINASGDDDVPMHPLTMVRNELHLEGGTRASYSKDEYMRAILYWSRHGMVGII